MTSNLVFYMWRVFGKLHWIAMSATIGLALSFGLTHLRTPMYVAEARLLIEAEQIPGDLASSTVRTQSLQQFELTRQRILTRNMLLVLAARFGLYGAAGDEGTPTVENIVEDLRKRISVQTLTGRDAPPIVTIGFKAGSASLAADVANEIVDIILNEDVEMRTRSARQTLEFFRQEVARLEAELATQEATILQFREQNNDALPDNLDFRRTQQTTGQDRLMQLERQIGSLQERLAGMDRRQEVLKESKRQKPDNFKSPEQAQLAELEDELAVQATLLSEENPRVRVLTARIAGLRHHIADQQTNLDDGKITPEPQLDLDLQRTDIESELAFLIAQKKRLTDTLEGLSVSIEATTANASALGNLERVQANTRMQYDQAVANMARAETGDVIEALRQGQRLSVFERAVAPTTPEGPNDQLLIFFGTCTAGLLALAIVLLSELSSKVLRRPQDLESALGIVPFAILPHLPTRSELRWRKAGLVAVATFAVAAVPVGLIVFLSYQRSVDTSARPKPATPEISFYGISLAAEGS